MDATPTGVAFPGGCSVVIPAYNECGALGPLLAEVHAALRGRLDYEVIVVDDGSTDGSADALARLVTGRDQPLRVLRHRRNFGQSAAILTGVRAARREWILTLDGDGQNDPRDAVLLLEHLAASGDAGVWMVSGVRRRRMDNWLRRFSSRVANRVRRLVLADDSPDTGCALKLFRRDVFLSLPVFDHMHRFLPALVRRAGGKVRYVDVGHRPRTSGVAKYGIHNRLWAGIIDLAGVAWLQRRRLNPESREENSHDV